MCHSIRRPLDPKKTDALIQKLPENQCIFIRGFRVKPILGKFHQIKAEAEPRPDSCEKDYKPKKEVISIPSVSEVRSLTLIFQPSFMCSKYQDPLHVILDYIAKVSDAGRFMLILTSRGSRRRRQKVVIWPWFTMTT